MITSFLLELVFGILNAVFGLIPDFELFNPGSRNATGDLPKEWSWAGNLASLMGVWDLFFPVRVAFTCLLAVFAGRVFAAVAQLVRWLWASLPGKGT